MIIRPARAVECAALADVVSAQPLLVRYGVKADGLARDLGRALAAGEDVVVADGGSGPLGFAWFQPTGGLGGGYLKLIALKSGEESRGVGKALLAEVEKSVARSSRFLTLLVSDFNEQAQRFYEREGYARSGCLEKLYLADVDELIYWKRLRAAAPEP